MFRSLARLADPHADIAEVAAALVAEMDRGARALFVALKAMGATSERIRAVINEVAQIYAERSIGHADPPCERLINKGANKFLPRVVNGFLDDYGV